MVVKTLVKASAACLVFERGPESDGVLCHWIFQVSRHESWIMKKNVYASDVVRAWHGEDLEFRSWLSVVDGKHVRGHLVANIASSRPAPILHHQAPPHVLLLRDTCKDVKLPGLSVENSCYVGLRKKDARAIHAAKSLNEVRSSTVFVPFMGCCLEFEQRKGIC